MSVPGRSLRERSLDAKLRQLTRFRLRLLSALLDRSGPTTARELAEELARSPPSGEPGGRSLQSVWIRLHHVHLPKLAEEGLVAWNESEGIVMATDHPALDRDRVRRTLDEADESDELEPTVRHERRRRVLSVLETGTEPLALASLARVVAVREAERIPSSETVREVQIALHHVHLPALERAGLVEYEADAGTVTSREAL